MEDVLLIVLAEAPNAQQHHIGCFEADGAVRRVGNDLGGAFDKIHGLQGGSAVQHLLNEHCQLTQPDAAGHALAAGLGMA